MATHTKLLFESFYTNNSQHTHKNTQSHITAAEQVKCILRGTNDVEESNVFWIDCHNWSMFVFVCVCVLIWWAIETIDMRHLKFMSREESRWEIICELLDFQGVSQMEDLREGFQRPTIDVSVCVDTRASARVYLCRVYLKRIGPFRKGSKWQYTHTHMRKEKATDINKWKPLLLLLKSSLSHFPVDQKNGITVCLYRLFYWSIIYVSTA